MKRFPRLRVTVLIAAVVLLLTVGFKYLAHAVLVSPLPPVDVVYPVDPNPMNPIKVTGTGKQQVFQPSTMAASDIFTGLDPKAGTCPSGTLTFLAPSADTNTSRAAIGINDFVYAIKINNTASNVALDTLLNGVCPGTTITSIGFCQSPPDKSPTFSLAPPILPTGVDFIFGAGQTIPAGSSSDILFYTSPNPPARRPTSIGSSGTVSQGEQPGNSNNTTPIYGPCPTSIAIDKQIGCSANGPFTDGPQTALAGSQIFYQIKVTNTGMTPLDNVVIKDPKLRATNGGDLTGDFSFPTTPGHLEPGEMVIHVFGPFTATTGTGTPGTSVNGVNIATATGDYSIPAQDGTPSGQIFQVLATDNVTLNVVAPAMQCNKSVTPNNIAPDQFPVTVNYTLKITNTGGTDLAVTIDDTKLRALKNSPIPGVTVNSVQVHAGAGFAPGMLTSGNLPANFPVVNASGGVNTMAQVDVSVTINSIAAFQSIADDAVPPGSFRITNDVTSMGTVTNFTGCSTGATTTVQPTSPCQTVLMITVPCSPINLEKTVACGTSPAAGDFGSTATALKNGAVVYRYKVSNPGLDTVNNVVITDNKITSPLFNVGTLLPGQMKVIDIATTAPSAVGPFSNVAQASGTCAFSGSQTTSTQVTATVTVIDPQINCQKLVNGATSINNYVAGTPLTYSLTAGNAASSGTNLDLKVDDTKLSSLPGVACKLADNSSVTLPHTFLNVAPGQSQTITCTVTFATADDFKNAAGGFTLNNTMNVTGTLPPGSSVCVSGATVPPPFPCSSTASASIMVKTGLTLTKEVACASPNLDCTNGSFQTTTPVNPLKVFRSADGTMTAAVQYRYRVTNTGDITINNINITDDKLGQIPVGNLSLAPGASSSFICPAPFTPPLGVTTNTAVAKGTSANSQVANNVISNEAKATVAVLQPSLSCSLTSTACQQIGDMVTVTLNLTNGPIPITVDSLSVTGLPPGSNFSPAPPFTMAANEIKALTVTFPSSQASVTISVTVNGTVDTNSTTFCLIKAGGGTISTSVTTTCTLTVVCGLLPKCDTICFRSPQWWVKQPDAPIPGGSVLIGGVNFNNPVNARSAWVQIKMALQGGSSPLQKLNQQFVAAQLNLLQAGGSMSAPVMNALWSNIGCYGGPLKDFAPVTLSDGTVISPNSMLKMLFLAAEAAIRRNGTADDYLKLATLFGLLNGTNPYGACGLNGALKISLLEWAPFNWGQDLFLLPRRIQIS